MAEELVSVRRQELSLQRQQPRPCLAFPQPKEQLGEGGEGPKGCWEHGCRLAAGRVPLDTFRKWASHSMVTGRP